MVALGEIIAFCDDETHQLSIKDFSPAYNGLQVQNSGEVSLIGAAVDANLETFKRAKAMGVDFLIVHHGLFWDEIKPLTGIAFEKVAYLIKQNIALYSSHLPLDAHEKIGNNVLIAKELNLTLQGRFLPYEGKDIGVIALNKKDRKSLRLDVEKQFSRCIAIEYGSENPGRVGIVSGSSNLPISELKANGIDTLITGELKQRYFSLAQDEKLNLYLCGHYATEVFGVKSLAELVSKKFGVKWKFIESECPL